MILVLLSFLVHLDGWRTDVHVSEAAFIIDALFVVQPNLVEQQIIILFLRFLYIVLLPGQSNLDGMSNLGKLRTVEGRCQVSRNAVVTVNVGTFSNLSWIMTHQTVCHVLNVRIRTLFYGHKFLDLVLFLLFYFYRTKLRNILWLRTRLSLRVLFVGFP